MSKISLSIRSHSEDGKRVDLSNGNRTIHAGQRTTDETTRLTEIAPSWSSLDLVLAGLARSIHTHGFQIAREMQLDLPRLEVDLRSEVHDSPGSDEGQGLQGIFVTLRPHTEAPHGQLIQWLQHIERRSEIFQALRGATEIYSKIIHFTLN